MSSKVVSTADRTLHFGPTHNKFTKSPIPDNLSFATQVAKARASSTRSRVGPRTSRGPARISAFYAPPAETAESLYQVLGIPEGETPGAPEIKRAYKQMARKYHPDVSPPGRVDEYTRRFIMVHEAYETLSDPQARASYDRDLAGGFGRKSRNSHHQEREEKVGWKGRWESQLDQLKRRGGKGMSWGERMRSQTWP